MCKKSGFLREKFRNLIFWTKNFTCVINRLKLSFTCKILDPMTPPSLGGFKYPMLN